MSEELCSVQLRGVGEDRFGYDFVLLEDDRGRQLPIWIDRCQAVALYFKLQSVSAPRPMTHDLVCNSIERLGGRVTRVLIDDLWQDTFFAKLCLASGTDGEETQVDCRPTDALAVALRTEVPIFVRDDVMEEAKVPQPLSGDTEDEDDASE